MGSSPSTLKTSFTAASTGDEVAAAYPNAARGKTFLITGANVGLGLETARVLASSGGTVVIAARSEANAKKAVETVRAAVPSADVSSLIVDLGDQSSIARAAAEYRATGRPLHVLINNAGVMACPRGVTKDGFEMQFGTNHLGHFALTQHLLPVLKSSAPSRVVNLSSLGHFLFPGDTPLALDLADVERGSPNADPWRLYGISKLANVLHAKELQRRMDAEGANVSAVSLHPGAILGTSLARHLGLGPVYHMLTYGRVWTHGFMERNKTIPEGVATTVLAALAPFEGSSSSSSAPLTPPAIAIPKGSYLVNSAVATDAVNPLVNDPESARLLWELSERMIAKAAAAAAAAGK